MKISFGNFAKSLKCVLVIEKPIDMENQKLQDIENESNVIPVQDIPDRWVNDIDWLYLIFPHEWQVRIYISFCKFVLNFCPSCFLTYSFIFRCIM